MLGHGYVRNVKRKEDIVIIIVVEILVKDVDVNKRESNA